LGGAEWRFSVSACAIDACSVGVTWPVHRCSCRFPETNPGLSGEVRDPSGVAVAGLEVTARNIDTNYTRTASTDEAGRYAIGPVPVGAYEVTVKPANMEASSRQVYVSLGGRANATFDLGIKALRGSVEVVANNTGIEPSQTFSKAVLTDIQLRNLPAN